MARPWEVQVPAHGLWVRCAAGPSFIATYRWVVLPWRTILEKRIQRSDGCDLLSTTHLRALGMYV